MPASAFSLAAARLGPPLQAVVNLSLHARQVDLIRHHLHSAPRRLALPSYQHAPPALASLLTQPGSRRLIPTGPDDAGVLPDQSRLE
ncbi:hypothetical protein VE26_16745, partial [Devosia chinhatensis]